MGPPQSPHHGVHPRGGRSLTRRANTEGYHRCTSSAHRTEARAASKAPALQPSAQGQISLSIFGRLGAIKSVQFWPGGNFQAQPPVLHEPRSEGASRYRTPPRRGSQAQLGCWAVGTNCNCRLPGHERQRSRCPRAAVLTLATEPRRSDCIGVSPPRLAFGWNKNWSWLPAGSDESNSLISRIRCGRRRQFSRQRRQCCRRIDRIESVLYSGLVGLAKTSASGLDVL